MRGTIISWVGERGIIHASGKQYDFDIRKWTGSVAPKPDMIVELTLHEDQVEAVAPGGGAPPRASAAAPAEAIAPSPAGQTPALEVARRLVDQAGKDVVIAYAVFAIAALFFPAIGSNEVNVALTSSDMLAFGGTGVFLVLLGVGSIAIPFVWKDEKSWLALIVPLLLALFADYRVYRVLSQRAAQIDKMGAVFGNGKVAKSVIETAQQAGPSAGFGVYVTAAAALYLAYKAVRRFREAG